MYLFNRWSYYRGRLDGHQEEAYEWCAAFDQIRVPNWQHVPVEDEKQRAQLEAYHRMYVQVFRIAKEVIGRELVMNRMEMMKADLIRMGLEDEG